AALSGRAVQDKNGRDCSSFEVHFADGPGWNCEEGDFAEVQVFLSFIEGHSKDNVVGLCDRVRIYGAVLDRPDSKTYGVRDVLAFRALNRDSDGNEGRVAVEFRHRLNRRGGTHGPADRYDLTEAPNHPESWIPFREVKISRSIQTQPEGMAEHGLSRGPAAARRLPQR